MQIEDHTSKYHWEAIKTFTSNVKVKKVKMLTKSMNERLIKPIESQGTNINI